MAHSDVFYQLVIANCNVPVITKKNVRFVGFCFPSLTKKANATNCVSTQYSG